MNNNYKRKKSNNSKYKINDRIKANKVRVIEGLIDGDIYNTSEAIRQAKLLGLDLVLISENANPPVCKVVEFSKFIYNEKKRNKKQKDKQIKIVLKEIQFTPNIGQHDYDTKKRNIIKFLKKGNKIKATVLFKGRNIMFKDRGELVLSKLATEIEEYGIAETIPKLIGRKMTFTIKPKKQTKNNETNN